MGKNPEGRTWTSAAAAPALAVFALAAVIYGIYGFDGPLYRDYGIYLYGGQPACSSPPPCVSDA
ncbi:MAG: hypothetical protein M3494_09510 [Actinomycetota bacterium]|nr:hypothetical protein [Rubrobacter sp.]MDQ3508237.1 hypothetical protein [Actinomycetota bacterium]